MKSFIAASAISAVLADPLYRDCASAETVANFNGGYGSCATYKTVRRVFFLALLWSARRVMRVLRHQRVAATRRSPSHSLSLLSSSSCVLLTLVCTPAHSRPLPRAPQGMYNRQWCKKDADVVSGCLASQTCPEVRFYLFYDL